jgi:hypothetical protein
VQIFATYVGHTGAASVVQIETMSAAGGRGGACIRHAVRAATLEPFTTPRITVEYDVTL